MHALSALDLINVWDRSLAQSSAQRALALLAAAFPETPEDALGRLTIGQRDACLLTLREWVFGPQLVSRAICPACGERLELNFSVADIRGNSESGPVEVYSQLIGDYVIQFRLPNGMDLVGISGSDDVVSSRQQLLEQCLHTVQHNGQEVSPDQLPASVVEEVVQQIAQADPQADVQLALLCPACGHGWQALFDIAEFFWNELNAWAARCLHDVHTLASAYGWDEADILAMSTTRRQFYLEMVGR